METRLRPRTLLVDRRVVRVFSVVVALPLGLAVLEILFSPILPDPLIAMLELPYVLFVYLPTAIVGAVLLEPMGIPDLLAPISFAPQVLLLITLLVFYYVLAVLLVAIGSIGRRLDTE